jgi:hypothetical protein
MFFEQFNSAPLGMDSVGNWFGGLAVCPNCRRGTVHLQCTSSPDRTKVPAPGKGQPFQVYPKHSGRSPAPTETPVPIAADYNEACLVLSDSPKSAAALGRRCLQHVLREHAGVKESNLASEIQQVLDKGHLPTHLAEALDGIRNVGNFAAHPIKATASGEITQVEPGEAEWTLDTLEQLFDFYFVQPAATRKKRDALNAKLTAAGKPPMK